MQHTWKRWEMDTARRNKLGRYLAIIRNKISLDSAVGIATGYRFENKGSELEPRRGKFFFSHCRRDRFWGPLNFLSHI
jgi:hypothetical protein